MGNYRTRTPFLIFLLLILFSSQGRCQNVLTDPSFQIEEATIQQIQSAFKTGRLTSTGLVEFYLHTIEKLNPELHAVIEVNPDALLLAEKADVERHKAGGYIGGLHGIPVLLKDNIASQDKLNTTAGSFALLGSQVPRDAGVVSKLRRAGAIILGKASLSEWAHFRTFNSPSGWSARGGQCKNPYVLTAEPCGSSTGSAVGVSANMVAVSLGTETAASILCPSSFNSVVGIKPTVGLTSRAGVIPVSHNLDTVGREGAILVENHMLSGLLNISNNMMEIVLKYDFKHDLNIYLSELLQSSVRTLADIISFNIQHATEEEISRYGQEVFLQAQNTSGLNTQQYREALERNHMLTKNGIHKALVAYELDALVTIDTGIYTVLAIAGYPGISVPAGYSTAGVPFGIYFGGGRGSEPTLIEIAYAFEQVTKIRTIPLFTRQKIVKSFSEEPFV